jgi:hypothetical protein
MSLHPGDSRAVLFEQSSSNLRWNAVLLQIARRIFEKLDSLEEVWSPACLLACLP